MVSPSKDHFAPFFNFWPMVRENSAMTSYHPDDNLFNFHLLCEPIELEYVTIRKTKKRLPIFEPIENMKRNHLDIYGNSWKKKKDWKHYKRSTRSSNHHLLIRINWWRREPCFSHPIIPHCHVVPAAAAHLEGNSCFQSVGIEEKRKVDSVSSKRDPRIHFFLQKIIKWRRGIYKYLPH